MGEPAGRTIAVVSATGLQGTAVTRRLLQEGWHVRALTRRPEGEQARALAALGADVVKADSADLAALERAFEGVHGVYNVQNHHVSGYDGELAQGKNVGEAVARTGNPHIVYASSGLAVRKTGVGSWDPRWRSPSTCGAWGPG